MAWCWSASISSTFFDHYLRTERDRVDWRFSPLMAEAVVGVAPAWFGLAECDPLVDECLEYADRLRAAGAVVDLELYSIFQFRYEPKRS